jgi:hypothetical protein
MYDKRNLVIILEKCIDKKISSKELSKWCFRAWYYFTEGKGNKLDVDEKFKDLVTDIDAQYGIIVSNEKKDTEFPVEYLKKFLAKAKKLK